MANALRKAKTRGVDVRVVVLVSMRNNDSRRSARSIHTARARRLASYLQMSMTERRYRGTDCHLREARGRSFKRKPSVLLGQGCLRMVRGTEVIQLKLLSALVEIAGIWEPVQKVG